ARAGSRARARTRAAPGRRSSPQPAPSLSSPSGERGEVPEDRRHVPVAEEQEREDDEREREPGVERRRARTNGAAEADQAARARRPAECVVQKRGPRKEPRVLLVDQEREAGDQERERHGQLP